MARFKGKPKLASKGRVFGGKWQVGPAGARPGQRPTLADVMPTPASLLVPRSPARATYRDVRVRARYALPQPRDPRVFAPFTPPPGLRRMK